MILLTDSGRITTPEIGSTVLAEKLRGEFSSTAEKAADICKKGGKELEKIGGRDEEAITSVPEKAVEIIKRASDKVIEVLKAPRKILKSPKL